MHPPLEVPTTQNGQFPPHPAKPNERLSLEQSVTTGQVFGVGSLDGALLGLLDGALLGSLDGDLVGDAEVRIARGPWVGTMVAVVRFIILRIVGGHNLPFIIIIIHFPPHLSLPFPLSSRGASSSAADRDKTAARKRRTQEIFILDCQQEDLAAEGSDRLSCVALCCVVMG
jgi:hypothetical protein